MTPSSGLGLRHLLPMAALAVAAAACVPGDMASTMYLDRDGRVTWVGLERDLRRADPAGLAAAIADARAGRHPAATVFQRLGATQTGTRVLRSREPAMIFVEGRFESLGPLWDRVCDALGGRPDSSLGREGSTVTWTWTCVEDQGATAEDDDLEGTLLDLLDDVEVVLEEGRFVSASGFVISGDRRKATLETDRADESAAGPAAEVEPAVRDDGRLVLALTWDPAASR